eukprot:TRINITY_DN32190_c0_g1_i1.p1 TRINITY_DN32190_c0_g1~~TRINITY_DN32190_c0_g1_i1.p1  ORF type:complete len:518 (+),score=112.83 TRINITY_DN32190_c0_g1_i1:41-1555(+)
MVKKPPAIRAAFALLVTDHMEHGVGCTDLALDTKERVAWAWQAVRRSPAVKRRSVTMLSLDVDACTVNGKKVGRYAELLRTSTLAAGQLLPLAAQSWDAEAPDTLRGNLSAKIGGFSRVKRKSISTLRRRSSVSRQSGASRPDSDSEDSEEASQEDCTVEEAYSLPMEGVRGAKKAAQAMLVASIFASELSVKERVPVLVLGRPPGHHATCAHTLDPESAPFKSPGGAVEGASMGGGCFYPSCWLSALHCLRQGYSERLAYIDIDAHKPDGVWKEVDHLSRLSRSRRTALLGAERSDACEGVSFASVHVDGYPNPGMSWTSADCVLPKGCRRAFEVRVLEELLPPGMAQRGALRNDQVLKAFEQWREKVAKELQDFQPNGTFVGLGFDLHKSEAMVRDKICGLGISGQHYRKLLRSLPITALRGPVVLTLEGGYTEAAVADGMAGVLAGLEGLARLQPHSVKAAGRLLRLLSSKASASRSPVLRKRLHPSCHKQQAKKSCKKRD